VLDPASVATVPWANGGGRTRLLVAEVNWQVSLAELTGDAPFSIFPGVDRLFVPLGPVTLDIDGSRVDVEAGEPVRFAGESRVSVRLSATTGALNVMTRRGHLRSHVVLRPSGADLSMEAAAAVALGDIVAEIHLVEGPA
jgi:environmental stress-induced protein Ves